MRRLGILLVILTATACGSGKADVITTLPIEGAAMEPALTNGEQVDVLRYDSPVKTGDLIAFYAPASLNRAMVKRVIAGPGQTVQIVEVYGPSGKDMVGSEVHVDGQRLEEPYVNGITECDRQFGCSFQAPTNPQPAVPTAGASPLSMVIGQGQPECERTACYFVMGDNRPNSADSRQGWLVPVDNIIGYVAQP